LLNVINKRCGRFPGAKNQDVLFHFCKKVER
jgi:hypothetical protein